MHRPSANIKEKEMRSTASLPSRCNGRKHLHHIRTTAMFLHLGRDHILGDMLMTPRNICQPRSGQPADGHRHLGNPLEDKRHPNPDGEQQNRIAHIEVAKRQDTQHQ
jgi:hypothetical protein